MKNNKIIFITILLFFINISSFGEEFNFKSTEINILEKGNLIIADKGVKIETKDNLIIEGEKSEYNKKKQTLKILGNVKLYDKINNIIINSDNKMIARLNAMRYVLSHINYKNKKIIKSNHWSEEIENYSIRFNNVLFDNLSKEQYELLFSMQSHK